MKTSKKIKSKADLIHRTGEVFEVGVRYLSPNRSRMVVHFLIAGCDTTLEKAWDLATEEFGTSSKLAFFGGPDCIEYVIESVRKMQ